MKDKFDIDFDVRVVDRNIIDSKITGKDYQQHLEALQDVSENAEPLVIEEETEEEVVEENAESEVIQADAESELSEGED